MTEFCCEEMREQMDSFDGPIARVQWATGWIMAAYQLTPSKQSISRLGRKYRIIAYCPFCGAKLERGE